MKIGEDMIVLIRSVLQVFFEKTLKNELEQRWQNVQALGSLLLKRDAHEIIFCPARTETTTT